MNGYGLINKLSAYRQRAQLGEFWLLLLLSSHQHVLSPETLWELAAKRLNA